MIWRSLKDRKGRIEHNAFMVEGYKSVTEALNSHFTPLAFILSDDADHLHESFPLPPDLPCYRVTPHLLAQICDTKTPQGICCVMRLPQQKVQGAHLIALDGVQDPGNVGTILRTADAAGLDGILLSNECADVYSPKVLRATMGSVFHLPCERTASLPERLEQIRADGIPVIASVLGGESFFHRIRSLPDAFCLVIGNEGNGISDAVRAVSTCSLTLPMRGGAESLNAGVAAGIMMYALTSREQDADGKEHIL